MTPEGKVKAWIKEVLNKHKIWYFMPRGTVLGSAGIPDFICCVNGMFLGIEAKAAKGKLSAMQTHQIDRIKTQGKGEVLVVYPDNFDLFEQAIRRMTDASQT